MTSLYLNIFRCEVDKKLSLAPVCDCGFHVTTSRSRTASMNDKKYWNKFMDHLEKTLHPSSIALFIGDLSLIPLAAARLCNKVKQQGQFFDRYFPFFSLFFVII